MASADSGAAAAGHDRPELRKAIEEIVGSGFVGVSLRVHDEWGEWVGSATKIVALVETKLRAAGIHLPRPDSR